MRSVPGSTRRGALQRSLCLLPCRKLVTGALPLLMDLDRQPVPERWNSDEEDKVSDEEFPELSGPFRAERGDPASQDLHPPQSSPLPPGVLGISLRPRSASGPEDGTARTRCQPGHTGDRPPPTPPQPQAPPCWEWHFAQISQRPAPSARGLPAEPRLHPTPRPGPHRLPPGAGAGHEQAQGT